MVRLGAGLTLGRFGWLEDIYGLLGHYLGVLGAACLLACLLPTEI